MRPWNGCYDKAPAAPAQPGGAAAGDVAHQWLGGPAVAGQQAGEAGEHTAKGKGHGARYSRVSRERKRAAAVAVGAALIAAGLRPDTIFELFGRAGRRDFQGRVSVDLARHVSVTVNLDAIVADAERARRWPEAAGV